MPILGYVGLQGSGKSYEVVENVILPNLLAGRTVVTNIAGLKRESIFAYLVSERGGVPEKLGKLVQFNNDDVVKPHFYPEENSTHPSVVQGGDVVIFDECWRWFTTGEKLAAAHMVFFRMHRHFTHPVTGVACDIVLIMQDISDLQRKVRAVIEKLFYMQKHKELGLDNRYVVNVYSGNRIKASARLDGWQKSYRPEIYNLYSSYSQNTSGAPPKEVSSDKRGNLLHRKLFVFAIPISLLCIIGAGFYGYRFFHPKPKVVPHASAVVPGALGQSAPVASAVGSPAKSDGVSDHWRVVGFFQSGASVTYLLSDSNGRLRNVSNPPKVSISGQGIELALPDGEEVTEWSGALPQKAGFLK